MDLTRSTSVNSMDTITEEDEQDHVDHGYEFGTEYSTDDEDPDFKRTDSCNLWLEPWDSSLQSTPLEEIVEFPKTYSLKTDASLFAVDSYHNFTFSLQSSMKPLFSSYL